MPPRRGPVSLSTQRPVTAIDFRKSLMRNSQAVAYPERLAVFVVLMVQPMPGGKIKLKNDIMKWFFYILCFFSFIPEVLGEKRKSKY